MCHDGRIRRTVARREGGEEGEKGPGELGANTVVANGEDESAYVTRGLAGHKGAFARRPRMRRGDLRLTPPPPPPRAK